MYLGNLESRGQPALLSPVTAYAAARHRSRMRVVLRRKHPSDNVLVNEDQALARPTTKLNCLELEQPGPCHELPTPEVVRAHFREPALYLALLVVVKTHGPSPTSALGGVRPALSHTHPVHNIPLAIQTVPAAP